MRRRRNSLVTVILFVSLSLATGATGKEIPDLPDLPVLDTEPVPAPSVPVAPPVPMTEPQQPEPAREASAPSLTMMPPRWAALGESPRVDLGEVVELDLTPPPFDVLATTRSNDISGRWWRPEELKVRGSPLSGPVEGPQLRWKRASNGLWGVVLRSRYRISDLRRLTKEGLQKPREMEISQGLTFAEIGEGRWQATSSPFAIHWIEGDDTGNTGKGGVDRSEILPVREAKGLWQSRIPADGLVVTGWTESAFNAVRGELAGRLANEELRLLLANGGEVVWVIRPRKSSSMKADKDNIGMTSNNESKRL